MTTTKASKFTVRQLTPEERLRLDHEAEGVAAEVLDAGRAAKPRGRIAAAAARVSGAIASAVHYIRVAATRENFDVALDKSAAFGRLVAQFGYEAAKSAVLRRVQRTVEEKVGGALSGAPTTPK